MKKRIPTWRASFIYVKVIVHEILTVRISMIRTPPSSKGCGLEGRADNEARKCGVVICDIREMHEPLSMQRAQAS